MPQLLGHKTLKINLLFKLLAGRLNVTKYVVVMSAVSNMCLSNFRKWVWISWMVTIDLKVYWFIK